MLLNSAKFNRNAAGPRRHGLSFGERISVRLGRA
jgi:hypothetical protein